MSLRGLRDQVFYVHNPLPAVTDRELVDRIGDVEYVDAADKPLLFEWLWKYDAGLNHETLRLKPGDFSPLREKEARSFLSEFAEQGAVMVEDPEDVEEVRTAKVKGLTAARKFYSDRGVRRAGEYRKVQGIGKDELAEHKGLIWPYYRNEEAAKVCEEEIKRLRSGAEVVTPKAGRRGRKPAAK